MRSCLLLVLAILTLTGISCSRLSIKHNGADEPGWQDEIIYHVVQRSFYDSNGDLHGDLKGFSSKLDYLKELGVTAVLLRKNNPVFYKGDYLSLPSEDADVLAFSRQLGMDRAVVVMNLSENMKSIDLNNYHALKYKPVFSKNKNKATGDKLELDPWEFIVLMDNH